MLKQLVSQGRQSDGEVNKTATESKSAKQLNHRILFAQMTLRKDLLRRSLFYAKLSFDGECTRVHI